MKTPKQVAPVERSLNVSAIAGQDGVEASFFHEIWDGIKKYGPQVVGMANQLLNS
ncbi:hypothetical protein [Roseofilum sp. Guam]|uniref:hypothetical protein n=1 Tax=Roseofilum sp. Guam TaxID=2821502 RepID=UPI001B124EC2|nr:hypothetical protein [Roseofilum sp. Guam]MBP0029573.1 hypothetical protein [Roseofilum sp. Guam]